MSAIGQEEADHLAALMGPSQEFRARQRIARPHVPVTAAALFLEQGVMARYKSDRTGQRQFLSLHVPGDFMNLPSYLLGPFGYDIDAITGSRRG